MNLYEIKSALSHLMLSAQKTGRISALDYNLALEVCQNEYFNDQIAKLEETSEVSDDLSPFIVTLGTPQYPALAVDANGYAIKPSDYARRIQAGRKQYVSPSCGIAHSSTYRSVTFLPVEKFYGRLNGGPASLLYPKKNRLIATQENGYFRIFPVGIATSITFSYVRKPATPFYDFNLSASGAEVYLAPGAVHDGTNLTVGTPSRTVELEWNESNHYPLLQRLVKYFAIPVEGQLQLQTLNPQK